MVFVIDVVAEFLAYLISNIHVCFTEHLLVYAVRYFTLHIQDTPCGPAFLRIDGAGVIIDAHVGRERPYCLPYRQQVMGVVTVAEFFQGLAELSLFDVGINSDCLEALHNGLGDLNHLR